MTQAFAPGIYPRSEALVQATRDLDRGRTTPDAVDEQIAHDLELVELAKAELGTQGTTDTVHRALDEVVRRARIERLLAVRFDDLDDGWNDEVERMWEPEA